MMTTVGVEWRKSLDSEMVDGWCLCMGLDERFPYPWDDEDVADFYWHSDEVRIVEFETPLFGPDGGSYAIADEGIQPTWVILPDLPEQYARDDDE
jgi:hypothetical protein